LAVHDNNPAGDDDDDDDDDADDSDSDIGSSTPPPFPSASSAAFGDWESVEDPTSGDTYYWNRKTDETTWSQPGGKSQSSGAKRRSSELFTSGRTRNQLVNATCVMHVIYVCVYVCVCVCVCVCVEGVCLGRCGYMWVVYVGICGYMWVYVGM
jgi:hypothetical protein